MAGRKNSAAPCHALPYASNDSAPRYCKKGDSRRSGVRVRLMRFEARDNTVSAENQVVLSSEVYRLGDPAARIKILILGNSITRHGPKPEIGWNYDFGMAASEPEHDYVHRLYRHLIRGGYDVQFYVRQASYWEVHFRDDDVLDHFREEHELSPDLILFRMGENAAKFVNTDIESAEFEEKLRELIAYLNRCKSPVVYTTGFWRHAPVDDAIVRASAGVGAVVDLNFLGRSEENMAIGQFAHNGVAHHPNDRGMACIASILTPVICALL